MCCGTRRSTQPWSQSDNTYHTNMVSVYTILWRWHIFSLIFVDDAPNVLLHVCNIADIHVYIYMHMYFEGTHSLAGLT